MKPPEVPIYWIFKAWIIGTLHKKKGSDDQGGLYSTSRKTECSHHCVIKYNAVFYSG